MSAISNMAVIYGQVGFFLHLLAKLQNVVLTEADSGGVFETFYIDLLYGHG